SARLALAFIVLATGGALADVPDLRLTRDPTLRHLRMRPKQTAAATPEPAPSPPPRAEALPSLDTATRFAPSDDAIGLVRDLRKPISIRFAMGYVVDGTALTGRTTLGGGTVQEDMNFRRLRAYALGEGTFSTRGVLMQSLSTYLSGSFQIANR